MTKTAMDDARLAVALREEAESHRIGDSYYHAGELMRDAADAIERLQDVIVSRERALGFTPLPDEPSEDPWASLLADCMARPCKYPCLRDDLGDWMADHGIKWPDESSENRTAEPT